MSFDLAVILAPPSASDDEIRRVAAQLGEVDQGNAWPEGPVGEFAIELLHKWPPLHALAEEDLEGSPWNGDLTLSSGGALLNIGWSRADEVRFTVLMLAMRHELAVADFQVDRVFRASNPLQLLLTSQGHGSFPWVDEHLLDWLVGDLHPGADWLIIEHPDGSYAQTALADDGFILETRTAGPESHIGTHVDDAAEVSNRLQLFARKDLSWRAGRSWESVAL